MPIGPQRLILIGSGPYEYAEVELAGALQIVGPNNMGKTTLIKTLQFLYIDDRRHMDFGSRSSEETRGFYFPNQYSYILFECLGATGQCVIGWRGQSPTSGGEPERFCYLGPYDVADFRNEKNEVRQPRDVFASLASHKNLRVIKSAQEHRELLLPPSGGDGHGLGIVSLRDTDKYHQFRETLKNLLSLSATTQEEMRARLLMLADIPADRIAIDARDLFGNDYDRIRDDREKLMKFKKNQPVVDKLVNTAAERETERGELKWRWTDLRGKKQQFEKEHLAKLENLQVEKTSREGRVREIDAELFDRRSDVTNFSVEQGKLSQPLEALAKLDNEFAGFVEELERAALANLKQTANSLKARIDGADKTSREKVRPKLDLYGDKVKHGEEFVARYHEAAITTLRQHFSDSDLNKLFRLLRPDLLEYPLNADGIQVLQPDKLIAALRKLQKHFQDDSYRDPNVAIRFRFAVEPLAGLENLEAVQQRLEEDRATLKHWQEISEAIDQREALQAQYDATLEAIDGKKSKDGTILLEGKERRLFRFEEYQRSKAEEPRTRAELQTIIDAIEAAKKRIGILTTEHATASKARDDAEKAIRKKEDDFNAVMGNFDQCDFPEFNTNARTVSDIPDDFDGAIALFLKQQSAQVKLTDEVTSRLAEIERWFGDEYRGQDESETVCNLQAELEGLADKEQALTKLWETHIAALKGTFENVLKSLGYVASAATDLTRQFAKVRVSNLKAVKLEVGEQSDLVSWIRKLAQTEQPGLFDDDTSLTATLKNFRARLEGNPVIRFANLFTLGFTVTGADGRRHTYHDFQQIESDGTTITIKVLFSLLLLKSQLRRDDCAVPFFLDEIQSLDPANRHAILNLARQLGFIAITAAPGAVSEVDALYFLQSKNGRIVLKRKHRVGVKRTTASDPP